MIGTDLPLGKISININGYENNDRDDKIIEVVIHDKHVINITW